MLVSFCFVLASLTLDCARRLLREKIETISPQFRMDSILFDSFVKQASIFFFVFSLCLFFCLLACFNQPLLQLLIQIGFKIQLSASDVVYAVTALLEATYFSIETSENVKADIKDPAEDGAEVRDEIWVKNFYKAFDALDLDK